MTGRAIQTAGVGVAITSHLNLTVTLADAQKADSGPQGKWKPKNPGVWKPKTPYAGKEQAHAE